MRLKVKGEEMEQQVSNQHINIGINHYHLHNYKKAIQNLLVGLDRSPHNDLAWVYLGMSYYMEGDVYKAHQSFTKLLEYCDNSQIRREAEIALIRIKNKLEQALSSPP